MEQKAASVDRVDLILITSEEHAPHRLQACGPGRRIITSVGYNNHSWQSQEQFARLSHSEATLNYLVLGKSLTRLSVS